MEHASAKLAPYKRPKQFFIVEGLPKNASGKVLKTELRRTLVGD
jgi:fatty-acyl-CoA synthase